MDFDSNQSAVDLREKTRCPVCDNNSKVQIVYGLPMDESIFNAADKKQIILGGCSPTDMKYGCTNCEAEYEEL